MKPILIVKDEAIMREFLSPVQVEIRPKAITGEAVAELNSWDEEGRLIAEQIVRHFPYLFSYLKS